MNTPHPNRLVYPIRTIHVGHFPLLDEIASRSREVVTRIGFDSNVNLPFREFIGTIPGKTMEWFLERARQTGKLEPLASLIHFIIPDHIRAYFKYPVDPKIVQQSLLPYEKPIESMMKDLSDNVRFQVQITPDNILGEEIIANGTLMMKSSGNYIVYRYSVKGEATKEVVFERLPDLNSSDLESTIRTYHNPKSVESPVLVRSKKPYSAKEDVLPYFAYRLTGLIK